jgi:hypothetical protein
MTIEQLAKIEMELYSTVLDLLKKEQTVENNKNLEVVYASYKLVHRKYSDLAKEQVEALKRGLFIQWIVQTEPSFLTGIGDIEKEAEKNIIDLVNEKIQNNTLDNELTWMLNYYANWDFVFESYKDRLGLAEFVENSTDGFPQELVIDKTNMKQRGQMGIYWNSLDYFNNKEENASR